MTRRRTRDNLPYATQELRRLMADRQMTIVQVAEAAGVPPERMRTLSRGNAAMRLDEAARIAQVFDRKVTVFLERGDDENRMGSQYVFTHRKELKRFQDAVEALDALKDSFKTYGDEQARLSKLPKYCYYDGSMGRASAVVAKETLLIDQLFSAVEYLNSKDTILLAGSRDDFLPVATTYMHRWWDESILPADVTNVRMLNEDIERKRCEQYRELMAAFGRSEAFSKDSFNPEQIELERMLSNSSLRDKPTSLRQAEALYCQSLTNLKKYEYFRFVQAIMKQSAKKGTLFGESLKGRLRILKKLGVIHPNRARAIVNATDITPIRAGYNTTTHKMSDTELARIVLSNATFTWFFSYEGWIIASDGLTTIAHSLEEVATCMRQQSFFAGDRPNHSTGIIWSNIPDNEEEFTRTLGLKSLFAD